MTFPVKLTWQLTWLADCELSGLYKTLTPSLLVKWPFMKKYLVGLSWGQSSVELSSPPVSKWWRCPSPDVVAGGGRGADRCYEIIVLSIVSVADSQRNTELGALSHSAPTSQSSQDGQPSLTSHPTSLGLNTNKIKCMKYSLQWAPDSQHADMPGTYHKMEEGEGGRRHKHRHHSHHRHHRQSEARQYQPSTDTSLEINSRHNYDDSLYGPAVKDSLYSGEEGDARLTSPGRFSPRPHSRERERERHAENTFDHVSRGGGQHRRSQEDRIWQDPVSRGAESGQINPPQPGRKAADPTNLRVYIEPGRPGSGLAAAAALVRGDVYTPEKISGSKVKVPPPVPQKPGGPGRTSYNKMGMEELWPGGWEEYSKYQHTITLQAWPHWSNLTKGYKTHLNKCKTKINT